MIGSVLAGARLNPVLPANRIGGARLGNSHSPTLIKRIPTLRTTSNNDATAMAPVLHAHTNTNTSIVLGNQRDPVFTLGHNSRGASRIFRSRSSRSRFTRSCPSACWRFLSGVRCWVAPCASIPSPQVGFQRVRSGSCVWAREGGGGRATRRWPF